MGEKRITQRYRVYELLESGGPVAVEQIAEVLGINRTSVPVYINAMKNMYKAEIESISEVVPTGNGNRKVRKVTHYKLVNTIKVPKHRMALEDLDALEEVEDTEDKMVPVLEPGLNENAEQELRDITTNLTGFDPTRSFQE